MTTTKILIAAAVAAGFALPAFALPVVTTDKIQPGYTGKLAAPTTSSANFRLNFQGSDLTAPVPNSRTPWEDFSGLADTAYYNSVEAGGFAEYVFGAARTTFSLMWGSPDDYNTLRFFDAGGAEIFTIKGDDADITSTPGFIAARSFVNVSIKDLDPFVKVRFESGSDAFEFANVAPVPLPAAAWMLLGGLAGLGYLGRKRREA
jgi:hypothetical protein